MKPVNCSLCKKEIIKHSPELNRLELENEKHADICPECTERFLKWQQERFARMFPTSFAKKHFPKKLP